MYVFVFFSIFTLVPLCGSFVLKIAEMKSFFFEIVVLIT